jgi:acetyl-CoA C-acetyltransferase
MLKDALIDPFYGIHTTGTAENITRRFHITRAEQDELAASSQKKCEAARRAGRFDEETVAIDGHNGGGQLTEDQIPRDGVTTAMLSRLKPTSANGTVTAGNSSGIADGASAVMLMRRKEAEKRKLEPMAAILSWAQAGVDPAIMGVGPVPACRKALSKAGWTTRELDLIEANESFAAQAIYVNREMKMGPRQSECKRRRYRLGPPVRRIGRARADYAAPRDAPPQGKKRTGHALHRRGHGHRAGILALAGLALLLLKVWMNSR